MIICDNTAFPVATVEFLKDGVVIDADAEDRFTQNCETLTIAGVTPEDEGSYTCRVQNHDDDQFEDTIVPNIVVDLTFTRKNPEEGDETTASCGWTGSPDPVVTWYKDGSPLDEEELPARIRITMSDDGDIFQSSLQIHNVMPSDTGDYACNVSNPVGTRVQLNRLEVQGVQAVLSEIATIGVAAGGAGLIVLVAVVMVLLCCVWNCARRSSTGSYAVPSSKDHFQMAVVPGEMPENYNVDAPDGPEEPDEAFNPDYASLPALRPAVPPQYKPTPTYPSDMPPPEEYQKRMPSEDDFVGPYGHDNGGMHHHQPYQPTVDDFVSDDAQFV
ncbi:Hemicentin-1 [Geodia barretti]|uniref:Hemicentin-1 n=1 Tax=Geodia barretti TaxID=519541 RepID=A0AA35WXU6_GEOBA|nr:Hemicentin-1 [Geodia barretti]